MRNTEILFGPINETLGKFIESHECRFVIIYDEALDQFSEKIIQILGNKSKRYVKYSLPSGEQAKDPETLRNVWEYLGEQNINRTDMVIALGGGSVTDLAGFVAATWMRGIAYINIPTTLLAMVDASVGGKTAVNTSHGKNLVGSFYMPEAVLIDAEFLGTLPSQEISNGLAEVVKCGFIRDPYILKLLEATQFNFAELIERAVSVKLDYVQKDPFEQKTGVREILNYGHTLGHALEKVLKYQISHGQAIAIGMHFAAQLSHTLGNVDQDLVARHISALQAIGLETSISGVSWEEVWPFMQLDKKNLKGKSRFIILKDLAIAEVLEGVDESTLKETYAKVCR
ncbi:MAG: 3-dehydroquinate synthase [Candidatus Nanopelagicales bacterium]